MPRSSLDAERKNADAAGRDRGIATLLAVLIAVVTLAVYAQTRNFDFLSYDDPIYTVDNEVVQRGFTLSGVVWAFTEGTYHTNYWAPLTWLTFLVDHEFYGLDPGGYHLTNVLWHVLNGILVFMAFWHLTGKLWPSFILALFFALHPLHVESVAWISERKDVVSTFFWMLTLIAYSHYVRQPGIARYSAVFIMSACCLMGKPMGLTLPFVLLLLDYWPLGRYGPLQPGRASFSLVKFKSLVWEKLPLFILVAIVLPLTFYAQGRAGALYSLADIPLFFRIQNVLVSYTGQILKTFWPVNLGILYPYPESLPVWQPLGALLLLAVITAAALKCLDRAPYLIIGWLWYLGTFVPVVGFFVIGPHVTADRYTYIPLIGVFIMVIWGGAELFAYLHINKKMVIALALAMVAAVTWLTWKQVGHWENNIRIYTHTLKATTDNWPVHLNLGAAYQEKGLEKEALDQYRQALGLRPDIPEIQLSLGEALDAMGRTAEVLVHYEKALKRLPESARIHTALAVALDKNGAADRAADHFRKAIAIDKTSAEAHHGLGVTLYHQGQVDRAIAHYGRAVSIDPDFAQAHYNRGVALLSKNELEQARASFRTAIAGDPTYADPYYALGVISLNSGGRQTAVRHFNRALQIDPGHMAAQQGRKAAGGSNPQGKEDDLHLPKLNSSGGLRPNSKEVVDARGSN